MDGWQWAKVATVFTIGWSAIGIMMCAFWSPLPRPASPMIWGYWFVRCVIWAGLLVSGMSGSRLVFLTATTAPTEPTFATLALAFAGGSVLWLTFLIYTIACAAFAVCSG